MIDPKTFELQFTLTIEETNVILQGLQELPAKVSNPLTQKLQQQAGPQLQAAENAEKAE